MSLTLVSGTPRLGLRARDHVLAPLHGSVPPPKDRPRLPTPEDINADPLSSDEESVAKEKIAALPLESSPLENGQEKNRKPALQTQAQSNDSNSVRKGGTKPGSAPEWALPPDPLDIKSAIFTSNKSTGSGNCSRGSRKSTASEVEDDEDLSGSMDCSQPSKRRRGLKTYIKPQNIHKTESAGVQQKSEKKVVSAKGQGVPTFKNFNTEPLLSRGSVNPTIQGSILTSDSFNTREWVRKDIFQGTLNLQWVYTVVSTSFAPLIKKYSSVLRRQLNHFQTTIAGISQEKSNVQNQCSYI